MEAKASMEEEISRLRELELAAIQDVKHVNNLTTLHKVVCNGEKPKQVRTAAIHSMRRFFVDYLENDKLGSLLANEAAAKLRKWFKKQHASFVDLLCKFIASDDEWLHALSIRTLLELAKFDAALRADEKFGSAKFGLVTYRALLSAIVLAPREIDVDLLLMLKEEVFSYRDCTFFGMVVLRELVEGIKGELAEVKQDSQPMQQAMKNALDALRVLSIPDENADESDFLVPVLEVEANGGKKILDDDDSSDENDEKKAKADKKPKKRASSSLLAAPKKKVRLSAHASLSEMLRSLDYFREEFSQLWLLLLSLPFSPAEHKLILKHLPLHVVPHLSNPLLLADYLTSSYQLGGVVAVLALESLFQLVAVYNLDYPNFFLSLYRMCTVAVFNAKYHGKFFRLLHQSLRSANLPAYLVAAFAKRLAGLALQCSSPVMKFCIMQVQWLLRHHQQALVLVHREERAPEDFAMGEEKDLEKTHALSSSLWELEALEAHYLYEVAKTAAALRDPQSTNAMTASLVLDDSILSGAYATLIDADLDKKKKLNAALAFRRPAALCDSSLLLGQLFG